MLEEDVRDFFIGERFATWNETVSEGTRRDNSLVCAAFDFVKHYGELAALPARGGAMAGREGEMVWAVEPCGAVTCGGWSVSAQSQRKVTVSKKATKLRKSISPGSVLILLAVSVLC